MTSMQPVRFSGNTTATRPGDGWFTRKLHGFSTWFSMLPDRIETATDEYIKSRPNKTFGQKSVNQVIKRSGQFAAMVTDYDKFEFPELTLFGKKFRLAMPPIGALILLLYPFTIGPRFFRAYQRDKKNNIGFVERGDVLRRDFSAITIFLFLLNPLLKGLNWLKQKADGLEIVDRKASKLLTYSQFENYRIDSNDALKAILDEKNGKGLQKAVRFLYDRGLSKAGYPELNQHIGALQKLMPKLVAAHKAGRTAEVDALVTQVRQEILEAEAKTAALVARKDLPVKLRKVAQKLQGEFEGFVATYAKTRRLPLDMLGLAIVFFAIGWFPVWFNSLWNQKKYEDELAQDRLKGLANFNPTVRAQTYQALHQSSALSNRFRGVNNNPFTGFVN